MDSIVSRVLEEICAHGKDGVALVSLWDKLEPSLASCNVLLSAGVKAALWLNLLSVSSLRFLRSHDGGDACCCRSDPTIQRVEDAERLNLRILGSEHLRDSFLGLYDAPHAASEISCSQREALEHLALARTKGITQSELSKRLGIRGSNFFYVVRNLESRNLITRQSAIVRTRNVCDEGDSGNGSCFSTNLMYLSRYANHLKSQKKFEILSEENRLGGLRNDDSDSIVEDSFAQEGTEVDVLIRNYLPAMKLICDKLEKAEGKVLCVSAIKKDLGYSGSSSKHKEWKKICQRLKDTGFLKEFQVREGEKNKQSLRLLKQFSPNAFAKKTVASRDEDIENELQVIYGRRNLVTEQLVELPIEQQIYNMVDASGSVGLTTMEVQKRLGTNRRWISDWFSENYCRLGMHRQAEYHQRIVAYRYWTSSNFGLEQPNRLPSKTRSSLSVFPASKGDDTARQMELASREDIHSGSTLMGKSVSPAERATPALNTSATPKANKLYPCHSLTADEIQREQRILDRLQDEKFVLKAQLYWWLVSLEKDKGVKMCRRTIDKLLNKLQQQGLCKCISITSGGKHTTRAVLHPSIERIFRELCGEILEKIKSSDGPKNSPVSNYLDPIFPTLKSMRIKAPQADGSVLGKMVRAKLLHVFFWDYVRVLHRKDDVFSDRLQNSYTFDMKKAIESVPLELFIQVVGCSKKLDQILNIHKTRYTVPELPVPWHKKLDYVEATQSILLTLDILQRLKLIRLTNEEQSDDEATDLHSSLVYELELTLLIEEPLQINGSNLSIESLALCPPVRHNFHLSSREALRTYWQTLERCYAAASSTVASFAFPGSAVQELFVPESWTSCRGTKAVEHPEPHEDKVTEDLNKHPPSKMCHNTAKSAKSTIEQVMHTNSQKCDQEHNNYQDPILTNQGNNRAKELDSAQTHKRKRSQVARLLKCPKLDRGGHVHDEVREYSENIVESEAPRRIAPSEMKSIPRKRRFTWTDEADRKLVIQYVKNRVVKGAKFHHVDWISVPDLPAPPNCCRRRISLLNKSVLFRKSLMGLCNMLSKQFTKQLDENQWDLQSVRAASQNGQWDNFDDANIKKALEKVLSYKQKTKSKPTERSFFHEECQDQHINGEKNNEPQSTDFVDCHLHEKHLKALKNKKSIMRLVHRSLAVSNAVELLKLVLLSPSREQDVLRQSSELLSKFSEDELFAAFSYLKEKKFMIGGDGGRAFLLSEAFLESISESKFLHDTGKQVAKFSRWLIERERDLVQGDLRLDPHLQGGEVLHLFGLVSSGKLLISPSVPEEGVGEAEDTRSMKSKSANDIFLDGGEAKRQNFVATDPLENRREKGFPGITVLVHSAVISRANALELLNDGTAYSAETFSHLNINRGAVLNQLEDFGSIAPATWNINGTFWDAMAQYAQYLMLIPSQDQEVSYFHPDIFRAVYSSIQRAGEQGLTMKEISSMVKKPGEAMPEIVTDVLQAFGLALKVNGYNSTRIVDSLCCSKYFFPSRAVSSGVNGKLSSVNSLEQSDANPVSHPVEIETDRDIERTNGMSIPSYHQEDGASINRVPTGHEDSFQDSVSISEDAESKKIIFSSDKACSPILPWINGDGTVNDAVLRGLMCKIFGFVMQNPGTLEDEITRHMDILNPQSCRKLLDMMVLDNHIFVRKMHQTASCGAPSLLQKLLGNSYQKSKSIFQDHFFANPISTPIL